MPKVVMVVGPNGRPMVHVEGVAGSGCRDLAAPFMRLLPPGMVESPTPEMDEPAPVPESVAVPS